MQISKKGMTLFVTLNTSQLTGHDHGDSDTTSSQADLYNTGLHRALYGSLTRCLEKRVLGSWDVEAPSDTNSMVTSCPRNPGSNSGLNLQAPA